MRTYRLSIYAMVAFALIYPTIAGGVLIFGRSFGIEEVYPFAPWALFCFVPNEEVDYAIHIHSVNGEQLDPPQPYDEYLKLNPTQELAAYAMVQRMAQFALDDTDAQLQSQIQQFEDSFLHPHIETAKYQLIRRKYDVLERWKSGQCEHEEICEFSFEKEAAGI
jgi:hypothetical protein